MSVIYEVLAAAEGGLRDGVLLCCSARSHSYTHIHVLHHPSLFSIAAMESNKGVVMARDMSRSILSRSIDQLHSVANRLLARCTETQETNTCEKPLSQTHVLIAVVISTAYDLSSSLYPILSKDASVLTFVAHVPAYYSADPCCWFCSGCTCGGENSTNSKMHLIRSNWRRTA